jgi:hypothetical protein
VGRMLAHYRITAAIGAGGIVRSIALRIPSLAATWRSRSYYPTWPATRSASPASSLPDFGTASLRVALAATRRAGLGCETHHRTADRRPSA